MLGDYHLHTAFSLDSEAKMEDMVQRAISLQMKTICITDHMDMEFPEEGLDFTFDTDEYVKKIAACNKQFEGQIRVCTGVELGLQPHLVDKHEQYLNKYPFDYVIGSVHLVNGMDPYYEHTFEGRTDSDVFESYFMSTLENVKMHHNFDALGHLDYVVRYGRNGTKEYSYEKYEQCIEEILRLLVEKNKALEINTAGLRKQLGFPNPHPKILKRFKELGGEMITLGSDAHEPSQMGYGFDKVKEILNQAGFQYLTVFEHRKPKFIKL